MLPSVLTLLDFAASGVAVADAGAQGVMPFPFGLLGGASDPGTPVPPPPPPPPSADTGAGHGENRRRDVHDWPEPVAFEDWYRARFPEAVAALKAEVSRRIAAAEQPPTQARAKRIAVGILDTYIAQVPPRAEPGEARKLRAQIAALRRDIQAYAAALAEQREADDEEDDIIGILLN